MTVSRTLQVAAELDSATQRVSDGGMVLDYNSDTARSSTGASYQYWVGERWEARIPIGATIVSAHLSGYIHSTTYDDPNCDIYFEKVKASEQFGAADFNISARSLTTASVAWVDTGIGGGWQDSPDLTTPLQELVDAYRVDAITMLLKPRTDYSTGLYIRSYTYDPDLAAKLVIEYKQPAKWGFATWK